MTFLPILKICVGIACGVGLYFILADAFHLPTIKTSRAIGNVAKKQNENISAIDVWLGNFASFIAKKMRLNEYKRQELITDLRTAQMDITPEMYIANAIVKSLLGAILSIPVFFIFPFLGVLVLGVSIALFWINTRSVKNRVEIHRRKIENDLPRLTSTIEKKLTHERGILGILESFIPSAGPELREELEITVADMRSGNEEAAVTRLEARVGSPMMSDVCRGFITMIHGDKAEIYWASLGQKFSEIQRNRLRAEASKIPGRVRRLSMMLLISFILIYVVVIVMQIIDSMGMMFGGA